MSLTPAQSTTLKTDLAANVNTILINGVSTAINAVPQGGQNAQTIADWYNLTSSPAYVVWKTDVSKDEVDKAVDWTEVVALTTNNLLGFQILKDQSKIDSSLASIRNAFSQLFPVGTKPNSNAGLLAAAKRNATNAEKLFASGSGTTASPSVMGYETSLSGTDIIGAWGS